MKKELFSIGEISSLLGLSSHTLRYYDKIQLIQPAVINESNGYRLYSYDQLFTIEHIRNLQQLGFSLDEIRDIFSDSTIETLRKQLEKKERDLDREIARMTAQRDTVSRSLKYYRQLEDGMPSGIPFVSQEETRWFFAEPFVPGEPLMGTAGYRLTVKIRRPEYADLVFLRHIGYILDYPSLLEGKIVPTHYFMSLETPPAAPLPEVQEIPAGRYLSFRCRPFIPGEDISGLVKLLDREKTNRIAIAREFEKNLDNNSIERFMNSMFEIQVLL